VSPLDSRHTAKGLCSVSKNCTGQSFFAHKDFANFLEYILDFTEYFMY
jgi:hypothetical protein